MLEKGSLPAVSPRPNMNKLGNSSMGHIGYSPKQDPARSSLRAPPFVSPGAGATSRPSWKKNASQYPTSSYLDKDSGTPSQKSKTRAELDGFNGLAFSPSPDTKGKAKVNSTSWRDKQSISFQATSPGTLQRKTVRPAFNQHFGGSFLDKTPGSGTKQSRISNSSLGVFEETPDIKIEVKIPDIDRKIRARRASQSQAALEQKANNVPEWKLKFQERTCQFFLFLTQSITFTWHSPFLIFSMPRRGKSDPQRKRKTGKIGLFDSGNFLGVESTDGIPKTS